MSLCVSSVASQSDSGLAEVIIAMFTRLNSIVAITIICPCADGSKKVGSHC